VERGYENLVKKLTILGAKIRKQWYNVTDRFMKNSIWREMKRPEIVFNIKRRLKYA
jgi:hypothetical protein